MNNDQRSPQQTKDFMLQIVDSSKFLHVVDIKISLICTKISMAFLCHSHSDNAFQVNRYLRFELENYVQFLVCRDRRVGNLYSIRAYTIFAANAYTLVCSKPIRALECGLSQNYLQSKTRVFQWAIMFR